MNKKDRKRLCELIDQIQSCVDEVLELSEGEQEKYDNLTENLQQSERGQEYQEIAEALQEAADTIQEGIDALNDYI